MFFYFYTSQKITILKKIPKLRIINHACENGTFYVEAHSNAHA
jgi:hypothetical protein